MRARCEHQSTTRARGGAEESVKTLLIFRPSSRREARRRGRPVTSGVSALWGFVANGHQAVRHVSSHPSEIPYDGFSPVRLQTGTVRRHLRRLRRLIGGLKRRRPPDLVFPALSRGEGRIAGTFRSRGPWLGVGLFCPVASSLTTASSELLTPLRSAYVFADRSLPRGRGPGGPCFQLRILLPVPPSVPRQTGRLKTIPRPPVIAFARMRGARRLQSPTSIGTRGCPIEAAKFAPCCGPDSCLPFTDKDVYVRAFIP